MKNFDLQIIWSAQTHYSIPGFLALHLHLEAERTTMPVDERIFTWFSHLPPEKKEAIQYIQLN
jgi:hypothetical protein